MGRKCQKGCDRSTSDALIPIWVYSFLICGPSRRRRSNSPTSKSGPLYTFSVSCAVGGIGKVFGFRATKTDILKAVENGRKHILRTIVRPILSLSISLAYKENCDGNHTRLNILENVVYEKELPCDSNCPDQSFS